MKKIFFSIALLFTTGAIYAQVDTSAYLQNTILANKSYYIGKPLNVLLNDLQIGVKSYSEILPLPSLPDPIIFDRTALYFQSNKDIVMKMLMKIKVPAIEIRFASPIQIPKAYLRKGALLDGSTDWTPAKANFFGQYIISSLDVSGL